MTQVAPIMDCLRDKDSVHVPSVIASGWWLSTLSCQRPLMCLVIHAVGIGVQLDDKESEWWHPDMGGFPSTFLIFSLARRKNVPPWLPESLVFSGLRSTWSHPTTHFFCCGIILLSWDSFSSADDGLLLWGKSRLVDICLEEQCWILIGILWLLVF